MQAKQSKTEIAKAIANLIQMPALPSSRLTQENQTKV
jgi:hypothetical protein